MPLSGIWALNRKAQMKLEQLLKGLGQFIIKGDKHIEIGSICYNSKQVKNQSLFFAIKGNDCNGYDFIDEAIERGTVCILAEEDFITYKNITKVIVEDIRKACAIIAANFFQHPSEKMNVIGITGTNGKTTTLFLIASILERYSIKCGTIGTISYNIGSRFMPAVNTTPSPIMLQMLLSDMEKFGVNSCVMEVSSHALDQNRVDTIAFNRAIFTNLTSEHLDYHKTMENYFNAKLKLFSMIKTGGMGIVNIDDIYGKMIAQSHKGRILTYAIKNPADISASDIRKSALGTSFKLKTPKYSLDIDSMLIGEHNIYNMLAAIAFASSMDLPPAIIKESIRRFSGAPGRMERIFSDRKDITVYVDYAHTDDALSNALNALREIGQNKIITVFGCGGNRDTLKRPRMANAAARLSDYIVITSDNPRDEDPEGIIADIIKGLPKGFNKYKVLVDRRQAIRHAIKIAQQGDMVLIAGKGHENYQIFKDATVSFDDRKEAAEALNEDYVSGKTKCLN
jgi:UDP-N-acetylmuramoyl-L-alanyl-D-glutamate--2,6-diaminopimelate ligase